MSDGDDPLFESTQPVYGENYGRGWIGFNHDEGWASTGIATLTRHDRRSEIIVSHAFIVTGENECVQAAAHKGVIISQLDEQFFGKDARPTFFRCPKNLTDEAADAICAAAREEVGAEFNNAAILNHVLHGNFVGWMIDRAFGGESRGLVDYLMGANQSWICAGLAAYALNHVESLEDKGVLSQRPDAISPQKLFECDEIFEPLVPREANVG